MVLQLMQRAKVVRRATPIAPPLRFAGQRMAAHVIRDEGTRGSSGRDNRVFVEGVLWIARTGSPWRDLPEVFGGWNSVYRRFGRRGPRGFLITRLPQLAAVGYKPRTFLSL